MRTDFRSRPSGLHARMCAILHVSLVIAKAATLMSEGA